MNVVERLTTKSFRLKVKQYRAVLDFVTDLQDGMLASDKSQQALATALNRSRSWISKVFRKKPNLTFFTAVELADAVGFDLRVSLTRKSEDLDATTRTFEASVVEVAPLQSGASAVSAENVVYLPFPSRASAPPVVDEGCARREVVA
jgi:plasmid maintenance system antidote protein VapI